MKLLNDFAMLYRIYRTRTGPIESARLAWRLSRE